MSRDPNNCTLVAAQARRQAKKPMQQPKWTNKRISFDEALAYAESMDRLSGEVMDYTASPAKSALGTNNVWNLMSEHDEWLACVWVDADGRYHIARDLDPRTEAPIEVQRPTFGLFPAMGRS